MRQRFRSLGIALLISSGAVFAAAAGEGYGYIGDHGHGGYYGFAGEAVGGSYLGAPLTRFPRPSELVTPAWGYGTYGVPTLTGIRQAPTAAPTLTVINGYEPAQRHRVPFHPGRRTDEQGSRGVEDDGSQRGSVRVISVTVPRR